MELRRGRFLAALGLAIALLGSLRPAMALDPQRPLTQALLRIWQAPQGLPRAAVFSLRQTSDGYLWLGTQAGLYRFDGVRFVAVPGGKSRSDLWIKDLCEDRNHTLWIATDNAGLWRLSHGSAAVMERVEGLPSEQIRCLLVDRGGALWVGTAAGLVRLQNERIVTYRTDEGIPVNDVLALSEAPDGKIWIGTAEPHICTWDGSSFQKLETKLLPSRGIITALHAGADETTWIGTSAGLVRRVGTQERLYTTADGLNNDLIHCLTPTGNGGVWVGTKEGHCRIQGDRLERFQTRDGLSQSTVFTLCEDHEGSLWVGTKHGLNQLADRRTLLPFTTSEGLPSNSAGPIVQDRTGNIWVGTLGAGLARFDGRQFSSIATTQNGLLSNTVLSLADGDDDGLWIGTEAGLCRLKDDQIVDRFTTADGLPSNNIRCLGRDRTGVLWVGTTAGLVEFRDGHFSAPEGDAATIRKPVQAILDFGGEYLIASVEGGRLLRIADRQLFQLPDSLPASSDIDALYRDQNKRIWMALRGRGLGLIDGNQTLQFSVKDGLYDDDIFGIVGDDKDQLWMACSRGIFSVALGDFQKYATGQIPRLTSTPFSPTDALRTIECQDGVQPAVWKMQDGCVWFSTIRGVIVVDPQKSIRQLPRPSIVIEEVRVNGQEVNPQQMRHLPPGSTNLDFHYTALSFASPGRITFSYKLEGFDRDWVEAGSRREAFYTNLPPGGYRFRVRAVNSDGSENEAAGPIVFTLRPFFYQTKWFLLLVIAGLAGSIWAAYRLRIRQIKSRLQAVLAERSRIARELHDTLIQGFSGVTMQLQALSSRLRKSPEQETLIEIIHDAGGCLSEARRSVAGLRNPQGLESGLTATIAHAARQLTETADIQLRLRLVPVATRFAPDIEYNILRIVQEAITNAIKHSGASLIEVSMRCDAPNLTIQIRDDGVGFDTAYHLTHVQPGHYGLVGMRERATQIGAEIAWRSEPRQGATVTLRRPLTQAATSSRDSQPREQEAPDQPSPVDSTP